MNIYAFIEPFPLWEGKTPSGHRYELRRGLIGGEWGYVLLWSNGSESDAVEGYYDGEMVECGRGVYPLQVYQLPKGVDVPAPDPEILEQVDEEFHLNNEGGESEILE